MQKEEFIAEDRWSFTLKFVEYNILKVWEVWNFGKSEQICFETVSNIILKFLK